MFVFRIAYFDAFSGPSDEQTIEEKLSINFTYPVGAI